MRPSPTGIATVLALGLLSGPALAQCPDGTPPPCARAARPAPRSVAVLAFENVSRDTADAYLADGFTDEITARLAQVARLAVTSRAAVRRLARAASLAPAALGRALDVTWLVSGEVRRGVGRVRVSVELLRAATGIAVWSEQYDREAGDVLAIEEEVAVAVVRQVAGTLLPAERAALAVRPTRDAAAYDHFLRGNWELAQRTDAATRRAIAEYQAATVLDPGFARARARAAYAYGLYLDWGWPYPGLTDDSLVARGLREADVVLQRDSLLSDAWMARAYLLSHAGPRALADAVAAFERALALDTANAEAYHQYGWTLVIGGHDSAAAANFRRALVLDPGREITLLDFSFIPLLHGRYREAAARLDSALAVDPTAFWPRYLRAYAVLHLGDTAAARADVAAAERLAPPGDAFWGEAIVAMIEAREGDTAGARARALRLAARIAEPGRPSVQEARWIGSALAAAGARDEALAFLEGVPPARRGPVLWCFLRLPEFAALRGDPRFQRLVAESRPPGAPGP